MPGDQVGSVGAAGSVHILYGSTSGLTTVGDQIIHENSWGINGVATAGDNWGETLSAGDYDCDGDDDLVVGAPQKTINGDARAGSLNVIYGTASGLSSYDDSYHQDTSYVASSVEPGDNFGGAFATGNFDADSLGCDDLAVGVPGEDWGSVDDSGLVHVFFGEPIVALDNSPQNTEQYYYYSSFGTVPGALLGAALGVDDIDSDGTLDIAVAAPGDTTCSGTDPNGLTYFTLMGGIGGTSIPEVPRACQPTPQPVPGCSADWQALCLHNCSQDRAQCANECYSGGNEPPPGCLDQCDLEYLTCETLCLNCQTDGPGGTINDCNNPYGVWNPWCNTWGPPCVPNPYNGFCSY